MRDYEPYFTEDGSIGLYSYADKDVFHSKYGALTEAWEKFVIPSGITGEENLRVLDVCYGIGYNTKALMSFFIEKNKINLKKKNFFKKIFEKIFIKPYNLVSKYTNKTLLKNMTLSLPILSIDSDNKNSFLPHIKIDCLEINKEIVLFEQYGYIDEKEVYSTGGNFREKDCDKGMVATVTFLDE